LVLLASLGAVAGLLLIAVAPTVPVATAAVILCGLTFAPVFPTTAGTASTHFSKFFGTVFGQLMALALLSGVVVPPAIGYVAQRAGVRAGFWVLAGLALMLFLTQAIFIRYERRRFLPQRTGS
jgi:fucose permease